MSGFANNLYHQLHFSGAGRIFSNQTSQQQYRIDPPHIYSDNGLQVKSSSKHAPPTRSIISTSSVDLPVDTTRSLNSPFYVIRDQVPNEYSYVVLPEEDPVFWMSFIKIFTYAVGNPKKGVPVMLWWLRDYNIPAMLELMFHVIQKRDDIHLEKMVYKVFPIPGSEIQTGFMKEATKQKDAAYGILDMASDGVKTMKSWFESMFPGQDIEPKAAEAWKISTAQGRQGMERLNDVVKASKGVMVLSGDRVKEAQEHILTSMPPEQQKFYEDILKIPERVYKFPVVKAKAPVIVGNNIPWMRGNTTVVREEGKSGALEFAKTYGPAVAKTIGGAIAVGAGAKATQVAYRYSYPRIKYALDLFGIGWGFTKAVYNTGRSAFTAVKDIGVSIVDNGIVNTVASALMTAPEVIGDGFNSRYLPIGLVDNVLDMMSVVPPSPPVAGTSGEMINENSMFLRGSLAAQVVFGLVDHYYGEDISERGFEFWNSMFGDSTMKSSVDAMMNLTQVLEQTMNTKSYAEQQAFIDSTEMKIKTGEINLGNYSKDTSPLFPTMKSVQEHILSEKLQMSFTMAPGDIAKLQAWGEPLRVSNKELMDTIEREMDTYRGSMAMFFKEFVKDHRKFPAFSTYFAAVKPLLAASYGFAEVPATYEMNSRLTITMLSPFSGTLQRVSKETPDVHSTFMKIMDSMKANPDGRDLANLAFGNTQLGSPDVMYKFAVEYSIGGAFAPGTLEHTIATDTMGGYALAEQAADLKALVLFGNDPYGFPMMKEGELYAPSGYSIPTPMAFGTYSVSTTLQIGIDGHFIPSSEFYETSKAMSSVPQFDILSDIYSRHKTHGTVLPHHTVDPIMTSLNDVFLSNGDRMYWHNIDAHLLNMTGFKHQNVEEVYERMNARSGSETEKILGYHENFRYHNVTHPSEGMTLFPDMVLANFLSATTFDDRYHAGMTEPALFMKTEEYMMNMRNERIRILSYIQAHNLAPSFRGLMNAEYLSILWSMDQSVYRAGLPSTSVELDARGSAWVHWARMIMTNQMKVDGKWVPMPADVRRDIANGQYPEYNFDLPMLRALGTKQIHGYTYTVGKNVFTEQTIVDVYIAGQTARLQGVPFSDNRGLFEGFMIRDAYGSVNPIYKNIIKNSPNEEIAAHYNKMFNQEVFTQSEHALYGFLLAGAVTATVIATTVLAENPEVIETVSSAFV